jgi:hypothetical protein
MITFYYFYCPIYWEISNQESFVRNYSYVRWIVASLGHFKGVTK